MARVSLACTEKNRLFMIKRLKNRKPSISGRLFIHFLFFTRCTKAAIIQFLTLPNGVPLQMPLHPCPL